MTGARRDRATAGSRASGSSGRRRAATLRPTPTAELAAALAVILLLATALPEIAGHVPGLATSAWHGFRFADLVLPFALVTTGMLLATALDRRAASGGPRDAARWLTLVVGLGVATALVTSVLRTPDGVGVRVPSLLLRASLAVGLAGVIALRPRRWAQWVAGCVLLATHSALLLRFELSGWAQALSPDGNAARRLDTLLLGRDHTLAGAATDPFNLLGSLAAAVTVLIGVWTARQLRPRTAGPASALALAVTGAWGLGSGLVVAQALPLNQALWTASFTLFTAGAVLVVLAVIHLVAEVLPGRSWIGETRPLGRHGPVVVAGSLATVAALRRLPADGAALWDRLTTATAGAVGDEISAVGLTAGVGLVWTALALAWVHAAAVIRHRRSS